MTGDVTLSSQPGMHVWDRLFAEMRTLDVHVPEAFMAERPMNTPEPERGLFEDVA